MEAIQSESLPSKGIAEFFSPENYNKLQSIMFPLSAKAGARLFWEGDRADHLYFVKSGMVRITKTTEDGKVLTIKLHQSGDLFGQVDPFSHSLHSFRAELVKDSELGVIHQADLQALLSKNGGLAVEFIQWMGLINRITETKLRDLLLFGKPGALTSLLIRLSNSFGVPYGDATLIDLKINNAEMADMIGTSRESVNRMLSEMKKMDVVGFENGCIVIKNINHLRKVCHCENCPNEVCRV